MQILGLILFFTGIDSAPDSKQGDSKQGDRQ